jgi:SAM-dependent methyltransferase/tetratricopeptide (TPR) repeat protein
MHDALARGMQLQQAGDLDGARSVYNSILSSEPEHAEALHLLGTAFAQSGALEDGIDALHAALEICPDEPTLRRNYAEAQYCLGRQAVIDGALTEARISFAEAVGHNPDHHHAHRDLGSVNYRLGDLDAAEPAVWALLAQDPQDTNALLRLGLVQRRQGDVPGALKALWGAIGSDPDNPTPWTAFADAFQQIHFSAESDLDELLDTLLTLLACEHPDPQSLDRQAVRLFRRDPELAPLIDMAATATSWTALDSALLDHGGRDALARPVVRIALERTILADLAVERLLTGTRAIALDTLVSGRKAIPTELILSLAHQCFLNGYVWNYDQKEEAQVQWIVDSIAGADLAADPDNVMRVALLGCYLPLIEWERAEEVATMAANLGSGAFSELVLRQIIEPYEEIHLQELLPTYGPSVDDISDQVREQYEEHPYPRWTTAPHREPVSVAEALRDIAPYAAMQGLDEIDAPDILVAGCGTGKHLIEVARRFQQASVTGIDLSFASLAFAARKASESGLDQVKLLQADILEVGDWTERFDIVDCSGVLQHMRDPIVGWRILSGLARPGGLMRIGLYSERGRRSIVEARDFIADAGFDATVDGIRAARQVIAKHFEGRHAGPDSWRDFFSLPECRDLLFHVQEHQFSLLQIGPILEELHLEFVGFEFGGPEALASFRSIRTAPGAEQSLHDWHE